MIEGEPGVEQDGRFPSGQWTGFFLQRPSTARHWMELRLTFRGGALRGDGHDQVGAFSLDGHYDLADGRCWWTKRYLGRHDVSYAGHNEGKGIWGVWEIPPSSRGGFHIWPAGMADPTQEARTTQEQAPVEAVSGRSLATPVGPRAGLAEPLPGLPRVRQGAVLPAQVQSGLVDLSHMAIGSACSAGTGWCRGSDRAAPAARGDDELRPGAAGVGAPPAGRAHLEGPKVTQARRAMRLS